MKYARYVIKPENIDPLWEAEDPCDMAQELLLEHFKFIMEDEGIDINDYNEFERRYEKN